LDPHSRLLNAADVAGPNSPILLPASQQIMTPRPQVRGCTAKYSSTCNGGAPPCGVPRWRWGWGWRRCDCLWLRHSLCAFVLCLSECVRTGLVGLFGGVGVIGNDCHHFGTGAPLPPPPLPGCAWWAIVGGLRVCAWHMQLVAPLRTCCACAFTRSLGVRRAQFSPTARPDRTFQYRLYSGVLAVHSFMRGSNRLRAAPRTFTRSPPSTWTTTPASMRPRLPTASHTDTLVPLTAMTASSCSTRSVGLFCLVAVATRGRLVNVGRASTNPQHGTLPVMMCVGVAWIP
jgi:hypothetical protein